MSTAAQNAREAVREARNAASGSAHQFEHELQALREDFGRLAEQVAGLVASTGNAAWHRAKSSMDEAVAEAEDKVQEAATALHEVSEHFVEALDESLKTRPYATLALVAGLAFLFGATWRR